MRAVGLNPKIWHTRLPFLVLLRAPAWSIRDARRYRHGVSPTNTHGSDRTRTARADKHYCLTENMHRNLPTTPFCANSNPSGLPQDNRAFSGHGSIQAGESASPRGNAASIIFLRIDSELDLKLLAALNGIFCPRRFQLEPLLPAASK